MVRLFSLVSFVILLLLSGLRIELQAQGVRIALEAVIPSGLSQPLFYTSARDGTNRAFIVEQPGRIYVMQPGSASRTLFLDISSRLVAGGERGLLGLAFHPQFSSNRRFFVNYTRAGDGATIVAEYRVSPSNPNVADASETVLFNVPQPFVNHNGGMIAFGPDGLLYIGMGDGGSSNDPGNRAQNPADLLGKMLRLDVNRPGDSPSVFALGLRNPWRFSFDRGTGLLYAGDVGQNAREEVDIITQGGNYGWRNFEGTRCNIAPCTTSNFIFPITEYVNTGGGGRCSITGGYVYRGTRRSLPEGAYIFGDYCSGEIFMFYNGAQSLLLDTNLNITSFGEDEAGEVYVVGQGGSVHRITNPDAVTASQRSFFAADRGAVSLNTDGAAGVLRVGYSRVQVSSGSSLPAGVAIIGLRQGGVLVSEASVPISPLVLSGRLYAEVSPTVNTGVAIANPNGQPVTVSFHFTDATGADFGHGTASIGANQQIAAFLNQAPFNGVAPIQGTFTFSASALISAVALRGLTNERSEFLLTTLPISELGAPIGGVLRFAHFADGGGWTTQTALVNTTDEVMSGVVEFLSTEGQVTNSAAYSIAARSSATIRSAGAGSSVQAGSIRVSPAANTRLPSGLSIFSFRSGGVVVSEAGVAGAVAGSVFRSYAESIGVIRTGVAIANASATPAAVMLELTRLDGSSTGLAASLTIPANGQRSLFLSELPAFASIASAFQGVVRISAAPGQAVVATSLRGRTNERGEFVIAATPPVDEASATTSSELLFPHFVEGGGYTTQFVLFSGRPGQPANGAMYFFDQSGQARNMSLR